MKAKPDWNLFSKYINNECDSAEKTAFEEWLSLNDENKKYFLEVKEALGSYNQTNVSFTPNKSLAWEKINSIVEKDNTKSNKLITWSVRIAAIILLIVGMSYLVSNLIIKDSDNLLVQVNTDAKTLKKKIILPDQTVVWLNRQTLISYPEQFSSTERRVILDGEAYFEVSKNPNKPFIIETKNTVTQVVGTSFDLRAYENENSTHIHVNSGKVLFFTKLDSINSVLLTKGLAGIYNAKTKKVTKSKTFDINYQSWKTGKLVFRQTLFQEVCKTLERHYHKKIILPSQFDNIEISASYNNETFEEVIDIISETLNISYQLNNDTITFYSK